MLFVSNLEEATPEDGDPTGPIEIHQLEDEGSALGDHGNSQQEEKNTETHSELPSDWSEETPVRVDHSHWSKSIKILCSHWFNLVILLLRSMP